MSVNRLRRQVAVSVLIALCLVVSAPAIEASAGATLSGKVFRADGRTPHPGVVVSLVDDEGNRSSRSTPTTDEGSFLIDQATAGGYHLVVETAAGAFVTGGLVNLAPGENPPVALTLRADPDMPLPQYAASGGGGLPTWAKWVIAGGIIVAALLIINEINDDETSASGF